MSKPLQNLALFRPVALQNEGKFTLPSDGKFQLVPLGNAPNGILNADGTVTPVLQIMDVEALTALRNHAVQLADQLKAQGLPEEMPTDFFHEMREASGWVQLRTAEVRNDGLYFESRLTNDGEKGVTGGTLRFFSPNFSIKGLVTLKEEGRVRHVRPTEFDPVWLGALTNNHNFRQLKPMSNDLASAVDSNPNAKNVKPKPPWLVALISALVSMGSLPNPDAADDDAAMGTAVDALLAGRKKAEEDLLANDLQTYKDRIPAGQEDFVKGLLKNDRASAIKFLEAQKPAEAPQPQTRLTNGQHKGNELEGKLLNEDAKRSAEQTTLVNSIILELGGHKPGIFQKAWQLATQRNPALFEEKV